MFRSVLIYLSKAAWARKMVTGWKIAWMVASRFVAGEKTADEEAKAATDGILEVLAQIDRTEVRAGISIKLTQIGLSLDEAICEDNLRRIMQRAKELNNYVRIDMEDTPYTEVTLRLFRKMRAAGFRTGIVIQAYLYRTEDDIRQLMAEGATVRLCKGAYKEPPALAFPKKADVDVNFDKMTALLVDGALANNTPSLSGCGKFPPIPAIASHDEKRIEFAKAYAEKAGLPKASLEFQMLNGIRRDLQEALVNEGYPVRVYVPYGTEWYPYFMRRLAERPANLWFFVSNFFRQ